MEKGSGIIVDFKQKVEFRLLDTDTLTDCLTTALNLSEHKPLGCVVQFTKDEIKILSLHPDDIAAIRITIPKHFLINYKKDGEEQHDIWVTIADLTSIERILRASGEKGASFIITDGSIITKTSKMRKKVNLATADPSIVEKTLKSEKTIDFIKGDKKLSFTTDTESFAFGTMAIEKMLRGANEHHAQTSIQTFKDHVTIGVTLATDEMEYLIPKENLSFISKEKTKNRMNVLELGQAMKHLKKISSKINAFLVNGDPLILTGITEVKGAVTDENIKFTYILAPLVSDEG